MKKIIAFLFMVTAFCTINAQPFKILKAYAFVTVSLPGTVREDIDGTTNKPELITERFIYIETNYKSQPKIDSVFYNTILFTGTITAINEVKHKAGIKLNGQPFFIACKKGNHLWRLDLQQLTGETIKPGNTKKITVKGKSGAIRFTQTITTEVELMGPERY
jgi:hypothetical protein